MNNISIQLGQLHVSFDGDLSFFIKDTSTRPAPAPDRSIKDIIESLGVPHSEVQCMLCAGQKLDFSYQPEPTDHVVVSGLVQHPLDLHTAPLLGRPQLSEPKFIADVHLGKLVRYLRLLGLDCHYQPPWDDDLLAEISGKERRIMLSRDVGLLKRGCVDYGVFLRSDQAIEQARQLLSVIKLSPFIRRFSRCTSCNGIMHEVAKADILDLIPEGTRRSYDEFYQCQDCNKIFWQGAHFDKVQAIIDELLGSAKG